MTALEKDKKGKGEGDFILSYTSLYGVLREKRKRSESRTGEKGKVKSNQ